MREGNGGIFLVEIQIWSSVDAWTCDMNHFKFISAAINTFEQGLEKR